MPAPNRQDWDAAGYARDGRFVSDLGADVLGWLDPQPGERILDLGCGDGVLTAKIAAAGASVLGIDASPDLVAAARKIVDAQLGSGEALAFVAQFDAVFSNAALHWMADAAAVVAGIARALKPGGRLVAEFGGFGNCAAVLTGLRALAPAYGVSPESVASFYFPTPDAYRALLAEHGLAVQRIALIPRPTPLPTGIVPWTRLFCANFVASLGERADDMLAEFEALLSPSLRDPTGRWVADYVRLRVVALKEAVR